MKLVNIEMSRVVSLVLLRSARGQPFLPDVLQAVVERYRFQIVPQTPVELAGESVELKMGEMNGIQIDELSAYPDGLIAIARAGTSFVEEVLDDVYDFVATKFGLAKLEAPGERRHYESSLVVELDRKAAKKFDFLKGLYEDLASFQSSYGLGELDYAVSAFQADRDETVGGVKRPTSFMLARRNSVPFDANYWFSSAPLKTDDHIAVLKNLEKQLL